MHDSSVSVHPSAATNVPHPLGNSKSLVTSVQLTAFDNDPVVKLVNSLLMQAVQLGASDLHFEPYEQLYRVRFRIDGLLKQMTTLLLSLIAKVSARLKIMAQMDISERRLPQDGRIKLLTADNHTLDYRVSAIPTLFGEKIVLRVIDCADSLVDINELGLSKINSKYFYKLYINHKASCSLQAPPALGKPYRYTLV